MSPARRWERWVWGGAGVVVLVATVALWAISTVVADEKAKAGLIGAASALTVALVTLAGGVFTASRAHSATARANLATERRSGYATVFATALRYEIAQKLLDHARQEQRVAAATYREERLRAAVAVPVDPDAASLEGHALEAAISQLESRSQAVIEASEHAEAAHAGFTEAYANALLLASPSLAEALESFVRDVNAGAQSSASRDTFLARARDELGAL